MKERKFLLFAIGIILIGSIFFILQFNRDQSFGDFALYLMQAKTLVNSDNYYLLELNRYNLDNSVMPTGPYLYPWGLPVLMSPIVYLFGDNLVAFKFLMLTSLIGGCLLIFFLFRRSLGELRALLIVSFFSLNTIFIYYTNQILPDLPYFFISLLAMYLIWEIHRKGKEASFWLYACVGFAVFFSYSIRTNGIVFLPLLIILNIITFRNLPAKNNSSRRNILLYSSLPYLIFIGCYLLSSIIFPEVTGEKTHLSRLGMITFESIVGNIKFYFSLPASFFPSPLSNVLFYFSLPFVILGMISNFRKDYILLLYILFNYGIFILWPYTQGIRYLFPVLPFYFYFAFTGFERVESMFFKEKRYVQYGFSALIILLFIASHSMRIINNEVISMHGPYSSDGVELINFINNETGKDDIIIFRRPRTIILLTDRKAILEWRKERIDTLSGYILVYDKKMTSAQINTTELTSLDLIKLFENETYQAFKVQ